MNTPSKISLLATISSVCILFCLSQCNETKDGGDMAPSTGNLSGKVSPYYGATQVTATNQSTNSSSNTTVSNNDSFHFTGLSVGSYKVSVNVTPMYDVPQVQSVNVTGNSMSTAQPIQLNYNNNHQTGTMNLVINGTAYPIPFDWFLIAYRNDSLTAFGVTSPSGPYYSLTIFAPNTHGVGDYLVGNTPSRIDLIHYTSASNSDGHWSTQPSGSGTISITNVVQSTYLISGTVSGTLMPIGATTGNVSLSGDFNNVVFF